MEYRDRGREIREGDAGARRHADRGAVLVEAALILPLLLLFVFGIIEFGLLLRGHNAVTNAAGTAARVASSEPKSSGFITDTEQKAEALISDIAKNADGSKPDRIVIYQAESFDVAGNRKDSTDAAASITTVDTQSHVVGCSPISTTCHAGQGVGGIADPAQCVQNCVVFTRQSNGTWDRSGPGKSDTRDWDYKNVSACPLPVPEGAGWQDYRTRVGVYIEVTNPTLTDIFKPLLGSLRRIHRAIVFRLEPLPSAIPCQYP